MTRELFAAAVWRSRSFSHLAVHLKPHGVEEQPEVPGHHLKDAKLYGSSVCRQMILRCIAAIDKLRGSSCTEMELQHQSAAVTSSPSHILLHLQVAQAVMFLHCISGATHSVVSRTVHLVQCIQ